MKDYVLSKTHAVNIDDRTINNIGFNDICFKFIPRDIVSTKNYNKWIRKHLTYSKKEISKRNIILENIANRITTKEVLVKIHNSNKRIKSLLGEMRRRSGSLIYCAFQLDILHLFIESLNSLKHEMDYYDIHEFNIIYDYLMELSNSEEYKYIANCVSDASSLIPNLNNVLLGVNVGEFGNANTISLLKINDVEYSMQSVLDNNLQIPIGGLLPNIPIKEHTSKPYLENYIIEQLGRTLRNKLRPIEKALKKVNLNIIETWLQFTEQFEFYIIGLHYMEITKKKKIPICFPRLSIANVHAKNLYYPQMALSVLSQSPTPQSLSVYDSKTTIVTGANSAGKTSFLKSIAQNCLIAQLGLPVLANDFIFSPYKEYMSVFSEGEDSESDKSRFQKEAHDIAKILNTSNEDSLVLLNEPFTSTNPIEAADLLAYSLEKLAEHKSTQILVTHIYDVYYMMLEKDKDLVHSYIIDSEIKEDGIKYLYKAVNKEPDGESYAKIISDNFGLSIDKLIKEDDAINRLKKYIDKR